MPSLTLVNPHAGLPTEPGWAMGFAWGFLGPAFSSDPPLVIAPELVDSFNEGVLAGQQVAISGIPIEPACLSLDPAISPAAEGFVEGVHIFELFGIGHGALTAKTFAAGVAHVGAEVFVLAFLLIIPGPPPLDAMQEFSAAGNNVRAQLSQLGLGGSLFFGAGIDENATGCELLFTPVFTRLDDVRQAVTSLGRAHWAIAQWDADAPLSGGGFAIIESSAG